MKTKKSDLNFKKSDSIQKIWFFLFFQKNHYFYQPCML